MKKVLSAVGILTLVGALSACGDSPSSNQPAPSSSDAPAAELPMDENSGMETRPVGSGDFDDTSDQEPEFINEEDDILELELESPTEPEAVAEDIDEIIAELDAIDDELAGIDEILSDL